MGIVVLRVVPGNLPESLASTCLLSDLLLASPHFCSQQHLLVKPLPIKWLGVEVELWYPVRCLANDKLLKLVIANFLFSLHFCLRCFLDI